MLANPQAQNSYSYAGNNPITKSDPTGRIFGVDDAAIAIGIGTLAMYAPQITNFLQGLATPLGQVGLSQAAEDAHKGNYGWAAFGALTAGELPELKVFQEAKMSTLGKLSDDTLVCRSGGCSSQAFEQGTGVLKNAEGKLSGVSVNVQMNGESKADLLNMGPARYKGEGGFSTLGELKQAGVKFDPSNSRSLNHFNIGNLTPESLSKLFTSEVKK